MIAFSLCHGFSDCDLEAFISPVSGAPDRFYHFLPGLKLSIPSGITFSTRDRFCSFREHVSITEAFPLWESTQWQGRWRKISKFWPFDETKPGKGFKDVAFFPSSIWEVLIFLMDKVSELLRCNWWDQLLIHFHHRIEWRYPRNRKILVDCILECLGTLRNEVVQVSIVPSRELLTRPTVWGKNEIRVFRLGLDDVVILECFRCLWFWFRINDLFGGHGNHLLCLIRREVLLTLSFLFKIPSELFS